MKTIFDIVQHEDKIEVWYCDGFEPAVIKKEILFNWLYNNDLLSWQDDPKHPDEVGNERSGTFTMEQYFDQEFSIIESDVTKYLDATAF